MENTHELSRLEKFPIYTYFSFPDIPPTPELCFEKLNEQNFEQLFFLFENDDSRFVYEHFKTHLGAKEYTEYLVQYGTTTPKHGGQDWFVKLTSGTYVGILHLYDLSLETFGQNHKRAWIGFATKKTFRNKGITTKAVQHFINYIFNYYPSIDFIHAMVEEENTASENLLLKCGFVVDTTERISKKHRFFILMRPLPQ
ncbi:MAG: GNAT family N-acetyltransferase [Flavisolibacter sp.]|nr:GNAT family N-acetyltransferase [Flavisolibacter sp.]